MTVEAQAFKDCESLEEIIFFDKVTFIGGGAFENCSNLKKVVIPERIAVIGEESFYNCSLDEIYYGGTIEQWLHGSIKFYTWWNSFRGSWDDETQSYTVYCTDGTIYNTGYENKINPQ